MDAGMSGGVYIMGKGHAQPLHALETQESEYLKATKRWVEAEFKFGEEGLLKDLPALKDFFFSTEKDFFPDVVIEVVSIFFLRFEEIVSVFFLSFSITLFVGYLSSCHN